MPWTGPHLGSRPRDGESGCRASQRRSLARLRGEGVKRAELHTVGDTLSPHAGRGEKETPITRRGHRAGKALPLLARAFGEDGDPPTYALLKGWRNYLCLARLELARAGQSSLLAPERQGELDGLVAWAARTTDGSLADLADEPSDDVWDEVSAEPDLCTRLDCPHFDRCFLFAARRRAAEADIVVPVPDSGVAAAIGYSQESGIPLKFGLIRNHYIGRTFIEPTQAIRDFGVKLKLNPVRSLLEGKRVVLVDDSIIRGTTSRKIVRLVREAGAREIHFRISCPPTVSPCYYGVDTPTKKELIASNHTVEEIREYVGADTLGYLSLEGLRDAVGSDKENYCLACYTASYPTAIQEPLIALRNRG